MVPTTRIPLTALVLVLFAAPAQAYTLWQPAPRESMHVMVTGLTAHTIDGGHVQAESELVTVGLLPGGATIDLATTTLKLGLTDELELHLVVAPASFQDGTFGAGDTALELKLNLFALDEGPALAVMPYVKLPTASSDFGNGVVEAGVAVPFSLSLYDFDLGLIAALDVLANEGASGYHPAFGLTANAGHAIAGPFGIMAELEAVWSTDPAEAPEVYLNGGLSLTPSEDIAIEGGVRRGLTAASQEMALYLSASVRI